MHLRRAKQGPIPRLVLRSLPSVDQRAGETASVGGQTQAFRAVLRGCSTEEAIQAAARATEPLPRTHLDSSGPSAAAPQQRWVSGRRLASLAVAMILLLGIGVPLVSAHLGGLAFSLGAGQNMGAPGVPQTSAQRSGMPESKRHTDTATVGAVQILPTATATATPLPPTATPRPLPPTPTPPVQPSNPSPPSGPYSMGTPPPGYHSFAVTDFPGDPWAASFGQCTWWVAHKRPDENFLGMGNALDWASSARARGFTVTATPAPNATVVFAPGVEGASALGHVSHVEQVLTGGWVLVSEMNFNWNGGGFARVDYRYVYAGAGVSFIH